MKSNQYGISYDKPNEWHFEIRYIINMSGIVPIESNVVYTRYSILKKLDDAITNFILWEKSLKYIQGLIICEVYIVSPTGQRTEVSHFTNWNCSELLK